MDDVVIVGGGIIGTATAYFLSKELVLKVQEVLIKFGEDQKKQHSKLY